MSGEGIEPSLTPPFKRAHDHYATRTRDGYTDVINDGAGHCCPGISYDKLLRTLREHGRAYGSVHGADGVRDLT